MTDFKQEREKTGNPENKFSPTELHLILNRLAQASFNAEHKDAVARCLTAKKAAGIPIDDKAIAICIQENKEKSSHNRGSTGHPGIKRKSVRV